MMSDNPFSRQKSTFKIWINVRAYFFHNSNKTEIELREITNLLGSLTEFPVSVHWFNPKKDSWNSEWEDLRLKCDMMLIYHTNGGNRSKYIGKGLATEYEDIFVDKPVYIAYKRSSDRKWGFYNESLHINPNEDDYTNWGTLKFMGGIPSKRIKSIIKAQMKDTPIKSTSPDPKEDWYKPKRSFTF